MGEEAKAKGAHVILGPTVNMQRSPLGGRGFESFSEDPVLAGNSAAAIVNGIQETGVVAAIKHFVTNDQEHERMAVDALVTERALREIYLLPFQIAVRDANPGSFMTAYNKLNGTHLSENKKILDDLLRGEWEWDGLIMSDWFGTYSTSESVEAGLDLEMPGPTRWRGELLEHAILSKKITQYTIDKRVREVLKLVNKAAKTGVPENGTEGGIDTPETSALLRKIACESIVLLKNGVLPLEKKTTAVIGPNAKIAAYCGGGSATLQPYYAVTPFEGISAKADVKYTIGAQAHKMLPLLGTQLKTASGKPGFTFKAFTEKDGQPIESIDIVDAFMFLSDYSHPKLTKDLWWAEVEGYFTPDEDCNFEFGLTVYGTAKLYIDGEMVVDNETKQRSGGTFFNTGTVEETGRKQLKAGQTYKLEVKYASGATSKLDASDGVVIFGGGGLRIGGAKVIDADEEIRRAVELAKTVDQVVLCIGLNSDFEAEGNDRDHMALPGRTDDLVSAVAKATPNTVVVVQSGTPVAMPWADEVASIVQAWYGGNETGNAIADVLFGDVNPSGKLPLSFPVRVEDNPAYLSYKSERGRTLYGEDIYVGYRWYETTKRQTLWPFGHGLSYTSFELADLIVESGEKLTVKAKVRNTGKLDGAEVVQVYISQRSPSIKRPLKELKGFAKVMVAASATTTAEVQIDRKYATSFWDEERDAWIEERGVYDVLVGTSSADTPLTSSFEVKETTWWNGL